MPLGVWRPRMNAAWRPIRRGDDDAEALAPEYRRSLRALIDDPRVVVPGCGGITGLTGHHGAVDALILRIPRGMLPPELEEYAAEYSLGWVLDRSYGPLPSDG
jgi:hypothetical protein